MRKLVSSVFEDNFDRIIFNNNINLEIINYVKKIFYLASPYVFSNHCRVKLLPEFVTKLEFMGGESFGTI